MEEDDVISEGFKMAEFGPLSEEWEIESLERVGGANYYGNYTKKNEPGHGQIQAGKNDYRC